MRRIYTRNYNIGRIHTRVICRAMLYIIVVISFGDIHDLRERILRFSYPFFKRLLYVIYNSVMCFLNFSLLFLRAYFYDRIAAQRDGT